MMFMFFKLCIIKEYVMYFSYFNLYFVFGRGDTNTFSHSCKNLGKIQLVTVGAYEREDKPLQDLEGKDAMWYCYQVAITDTSTGDKYLFPCKDWIQIGSSAFKRSMGKELDLKDVEQSQVSVVRSKYMARFYVWKVKLYTVEPR
jgi:hypothetical protein